MARQDSSLFTEQNFDYGKLTLLESKIESKIGNQSKKYPACCGTVFSELQNLLLRRVQPGKVIFALK